MNIISKNLNLLTIFEVLWQTRSVSKGAKMMNLSQPAMSHALSRLRDMFEDDLFVKGQSGLIPTKKAQGLFPTIHQVLSELEDTVFASEGEFKPQNIDAKIILGTTDYFDQLVLPWLIPHLRQKAPGLVLITTSISTTKPKKILAERTCDLAIAGFFEALPDGVYKQKLFEEDYVVATGQENPSIKSKLSLKTYCQSHHILISPQGDLDGIVDKVLATKKLKRRIVAGVSNFQIPLQIVAQSDLMITAPRRLVENYLSKDALKVFDPPIKIPGFTVAQVWHGRSHKDPVHRWLRGEIFDYCQRM